MTITRALTGFGPRIYGLGVMALAVAGLMWGTFTAGQPVPKDFPDRTALAYFAGALMLAAGAAVIWRRSAVWGAAALAAYYALVVVVLMDGRVLLAHYEVYVVYENIAEQLAIAAGALIIYAANAKIDAALSARLTTLGRMAFGVCAVVFGGAHFAYMNLTAPLVPAWLPPGQTFWGYATGAAHIAGGVTILARWRARLAATLLALMYASFIPLVWAPVLLADPSRLGRWTETATTLALAGVAAVVANSLPPAAVRHIALIPSKGRSGD